MSLLLNRGAIARAVLGELAPRAEAKLRAHLGGCPRCRAHYDGLSRTAAALGRGRAAPARERERLFAALALPAQRPPSPRRRIWIGAAALVPAAAVAILLIARGRPSPAPNRDDVTLRGDSAPVAPPTATVTLYASRKLDAAGHGPVRLIGELPGSGEAHVSLGDYLQLGLRGLRAPAHVRVAGVDEAGRVHDYVRDTAVAPRNGPLTFGGSIDLGREHQTGRVRLVAVFSSQTIDDAALGAAIAGHASRGTDRQGGAGPNVVTGLVVIGP
jgi:hypothetical protein